MRASLKTLDPSDERLGPLLFDRLIQLDERGQPRPALAMSWEHDAQKKRWQFRLRPMVKFHDGSALDAASAAAALRASVSGDSIVIQSDRLLPDLLFKLAGPRGAIFRRAAGGLSGTGPFRIIQWDP